MSSEFIYHPRALMHDFDWVHMHWVGQWLYTVIQGTQEERAPGVYVWNLDSLSVQAQALTQDDVMAAAEELASAGYLMVDERSNECYLRKFLYYDNFIKAPNMLVNLTTRILSVASWEVRSAIVSDLRVLRDMYPDLSGWKRPKVSELLKASYETPKHAWFDARGRGVVGYEQSKKLDIPEGVSDPKND